MWIITGCCFLLPLHSEDKRDEETGYRRDTLTGTRLNRDELISHFGRDGIFKN